MQRGTKDLEIRPPSAAGSRS